MTIHEILRLVGAQPKEGLLFFKEGNFMKCYNHHAMYFTSNVKEMKVHTRFYKNANCYVHSMGFPVNALERYINYIQAHYGGAEVESHEDHVVLKNVQWHTFLDYDLWQMPKIQEKETESASARMKKELSEGIDILKPTDKILNMIAGFEIEKATPLDAFNFVQKLKKQVS
ncbi:hypothetical protein ACT4R9_08425 [Ornithobacterium rhinotracheale]|uniref:hypothetical protein n=1 Tax=Ornithobacterium rhinotracheale TaxID=28251 RepID=UPI0039FD3889